MPGLHEHILDHEILETANLKTFVFLDSSDYMEEPERPLLEITLPGYTKYFLVNYIAKQVNTFNSSTIGLNKVLNQDYLTDLPDGVWTIKQKICPYNYVYKIKKYFRITQLILKLDKLYSNVDMSQCQSKDDKDLQEDIAQINGLIGGIQPATRIGDIEKANGYYKLANRMIEKLLDKFCKSCK